MRYPLPGTLMALGLIGLLAVIPAAAQPDLPTGPDVMGGPFPTIFPTSVAYHIWMDRDGFEIRWSSRGGLRAFSGEVTTDGKIERIRQVDLERGELRRVGDRTLVWRATTRGGSEGFGFALSRKADWVRFTLLIDGRLAHPQQIFIGRRGIHPPGNPVTFRLREGRDQDRDRDRWPAAYRGQPFFGARVIPGYAAWHDGEEWHIRWTMGGWRREVSGLISTDGRFTGVRRVRFEGGDLLAHDRGLIAWEARSAGGIDGLDFRPTGDRMTFTLLVGGSPVSPSQIYLGAGGLHPAGNPFRVTR